MAAMLVLTPVKPKVQRHICFVCQNVAKDPQRLDHSKKGNALKQRLARYVQLHVEDGTMCRNCSRSLDTIQKNVEKFRSRVVGIDSPGAKRCALRDDSLAKRLAVTVQVFTTFIIQPKSIINFVNNRLNHAQVV